MLTKVMTMQSELTISLFGIVSQCCWRRMSHSYWSGCITISWSPIRDGVDPATHDNPQLRHTLRCRE
ncbi:putative efflux pump kojT [Fusarium oxysporum f. sp. albedinis]|nr:putative efflux pump kojT [Fusarium oxysporum f. sp. albedinis]